MFRMKVYRRNEGYRYKISPCKCGCTIYMVIGTVCEYGDVGRILRPPLESDQHYLARAVGALHRHQTQFFS